MGLINKSDVQETVIKLHRAGKSYPNEYVRINKCRTQEEIDNTFRDLVVQLTDSIFDWFSHAGLPSKEVWEKATYKAMGLRGDVTAELMINAIKEIRAEQVAEAVGKPKTPEEKRAEPLQDFNPLSSEDKLCNAMLWKFTSIFLGKRILFGDYPISNQEIECEMDRLGIPVAKAGFKRKVVEAGLKLRHYNKDKNITERLQYGDGTIKTVPKRVISVCKGVPVIFECMPEEYINSLNDRDMQEIWLKLL